MKKILILLAMMSIPFLATAEQHVKYFRYNLCLDVAGRAKCDLESIINQGNKIVSFSLDYEQKAMVVCYDDGR